MEHPEYNLNTKANDVALILLNENVIVTPHVRPICLWDDDYDLQKIQGNIGVVSKTHFYFWIYTLKQSAGCWLGINERHQSTLWTTSRRNSRTQLPRVLFAREAVLWQISQTGRQLLRRW